MFLCPQTKQAARPGGERDIDRGAEPSADEVLHQRDPHRPRIRRHHPHHNLHSGMREVFTQKMDCMGSTYSLERAGWDPLKKMRNHENMFELICLSLIAIIFTPGLSSI